MRSGYVTAAAEVSAADSLRGPMILGAATAIVGPELGADIAKSLEGRGVLIGAAAAEAVAKLPDGAVPVRVVIVAIVATPQATPKESEG